MIRQGLLASPGSTGVRLFGEERHHWVSLWGREVGVSLHSSVGLRLQGYWKRLLLELCAALREGTPHQAIPISVLLLLCLHWIPPSAGSQCPKGPGPMICVKRATDTGVPAGTPQEWMSSCAVLPCSLHTTAPVPWLSYNARGLQHWLQPHQILAVWPRAFHVTTLSSRFPPLSMGYQRLLTGFLWD